MPAPNPAAAAAYTALAVKKTPHGWKPRAGARPELQRIAATTIIREAR